MNAIKYFDSIASNWNKIRKEYFGDEIKKIVFQKIEFQNKICADLGCGSGFLSLEAAKHASIVFSVDISKNMLKELKTSAERMGLKNIYPIKGNMTDIPLFDNSVDIVFSNMALHHIVEPNLAFKEIQRILKPNGIVLLTDVEEHDGYWAKEEMFDEWLGFSHEQIRNWMHNAGFKEIKVQSTGLICKGYSSKGDFTQTGIFLAMGRKE